VRPVGFDKRHVGQVAGAQIRVRLHETLDVIRQHACLILQMASAIRIHAWHAHTDTLTCDVHVQSMARMTKSPYSVNAYVTMACALRLEPNAGSTTVTIS
jgi:hypothetical protein